jgi:REP element-mobilizing transposase RayT
MANTYSQIYLQFVFAVKLRQNLIRSEHKEELHKYITSLVETRKAKMLAIHCMPDHLHFFVGFNPNILIADFVKEIKVKSNEFINEKKWVGGKFAWQEGYGVFSYAHSQINAVIKYILNQEQHHKKKTFREEYAEFLEKFSITFDNRYLFDFIENKDKEVLPTRGT